MVYVSQSREPEAIIYMNTWARTMLPGCQLFVAMAPVNMRITTEADGAFPIGTRVTSQEYMVVCLSGSRPASMVKCFFSELADQMDSYITAEKPELAGQLQLNMVQLGLAVPEEQVEVFASKPEA
jgi:hypothetical protein